jgi:methionyl-tRNA formyltransferase
MKVIIVTQKPIQALNLIYLLGSKNIFPVAIIAQKPGIISKERDLIDEFAESISALKLQCRILSIQFEEVNDLNSSHTIDFLNSLKVDLIISLVAEIIKKEFINTSKHGVLSSHGGILPKYRGVDCLSWTILNNDFSCLGITTQLIDSGVDTGKIVNQHRINLYDIKPFDLSDLHKILFYKFKLKSFVEVLEIFIKQGKMNAIKQNLSDGKQYFTMHPKLQKVVEKRLNSI